MTKVLKLEEFLKISNKDLKGKIICFPTDTVYGIGACLLDDEGIEKIYNMKHRDKNKPLAVLVGSYNDALKIAKTNPLGSFLMKKYWPGGLTVILNKKEIVNNLAFKDLTTIGVRMPNSSISLKILEKLGPMATTSVNISGMPSMNNVDDIKKQFDGIIDYIISDEVSLEEVASTVVLATGEELKILRQGMLEIPLNERKSIMTISMASDHAGYERKEQVKKYLEGLGIKVLDFGTNDTTSCDYADFAYPACKAVVNNEANLGILICYTGIGMSMTANKVKGIRAGLVFNKENAHLTREHNNANVLCMGAKDVDEKTAIEIVNEFINTTFAGGRHERRINKVMAIENEQ